MRAPTAGRIAARALELRGALLERGRPQNVDRIWQAARRYRLRAVAEAARVLLSFERPALPSVSGAKAQALMARRLFADLENCTVANDTGITGWKL